MLRPLFQGLEDAEWQRVAGDVVLQHVLPVVGSVVQQRLGVSLHQPDGEDIRSDVLVRLFRRLRRPTADEEPIADLRGYVAVMAHHACDEHFRRMHPGRARLKNRLRYALTHQPELALWAGQAGEWLCGLERWRAAAPRAARVSTRSGDAPLEPLAFRFGDVDPRGLDTVDLLIAVFEQVGRPVELDELVGLVATLRGIDDRGAGSEAGRSPQADPEREVVDPHPGIAAELDQRLYLERLWAEVCILPPRQRAALLLNLRDRQGGGILTLFPLTGVAGVPEIAAALVMSAPDLAALWNHLPLDDAAIADRLGVTRQQVINLRKSARERLARRLRAAGYPDAR